MDFCPLGLTWRTFSQSAKIADVISMTRRNTWDESNLILCKFIFTQNPVVVHYWIIGAFGSYVPYSVGFPLALSIHTARFSAQLLLRWLKWQLAAACILTQGVREGLCINQMFFWFEPTILMIQQLWKFWLWRCVSLRVNRVLLPNFVNIKRPLSEYQRAT